ncbi:MAG: 4-oxalocrotonate tautomerase [Lachnospiraceae bacterium]|jgi:4-oxalocrotonate tautomerase|nr:4-oxalocrotonate tautomerase [Lachnospiraceae bacterium]
MPHVVVKCYPGRSEEQKSKCAEEIADVVAKTLGCGISDVSVAIKDIQKENWKAEVVDKEILPDEKFLYKKAE